MNKLLFPILYLALAAIFISSCKKESTPDNNANGPSVLLRTEGFLCTMGVARDGSIDTLTYYQTTIAKEMTVYFNAYLPSSEKHPGQAAAEPIATLALKLIRTRLFPPFHIMTIYGIFRMKAHLRKQNLL